MDINRSTEQSLMVESGSGRGGGGGCGCLRTWKSHIDRWSCRHTHARTHLSNKCTTVTLAYVRVGEAAWGTLYRGIVVGSGTETYRMTQREGRKVGKMRGQTSEVQATKRQRLTSENVRYVTGSLLDLSGSERLLVCHPVKTHIIEKHQLHSSCL